ncbi:MAG: hypothetical protein ACK4ZN_03770 [Oceanibaculum sp.]
MTLRVRQLLLAALLSLAPMAMVLAIAATPATAASGSQSGSSAARFVNIGPYLINFFLDEKPVAGRLSLTLEAKDQIARTALTQNGQLVDSMVLPLAIDLYSHGRPSQQRIRDFKLKLIDALNRQFGEVVTEVYIRSLM